MKNVKGWVLEKYFLFYFFPQRKEGELGIRNIFKITLLKEFIAKKRDVCTVASRRESRELNEVAWCCSYPLYKYIKKACNKKCRLFLR
ncbi:hypothetical protein [Parasediminibacterium sp. JCM 36343]|uniref:hypothetical protein n=1 Tax=Parasediminibacterium sp. JCM 36343 TaxID=3374279 RepID=UPI00397B38DD